MRILVSGGGTAGHISPILATVDALKQLDKSVELLYVGQKGSMEAKIAVAAGLRFEAIPAGKYRRYQGVSLISKLTDISTIALNLRDGFRTLVGVFKAWQILGKFKPDAIFLKGGFVALPVGLAARWRRMPYIIHESDTRPGLSNRILSGSAARIAVNFPINYYSKIWPSLKLVHTGIPVRKEFISRHRLEGLSYFGLQDDVPVVMIMGGSSGSRRINQTVIEALPELTAQYDVIHVTGEREIERVRFEVKRLKLVNPKRYQVRAFLGSELGLAYAAADLVISRAGANSIAELAVLGKPVILIPASQLGDQPLNAQTLSRVGAARLLQESKLSSRVLAAEIKRILEDPDEEQALSHQIKQFAVSDADQRLARLIMEVAGETGEDQ